MPGYKLEVNGVYPRIESLLCPYCEDILREAIQTEQGIRLCLSCYHDIQKNPKVLEKYEDIELEPNEPFHPDKAVRREVNKIPVKCENFQLGCEWTGPLVEHETDHKLACQYKSEACPNGCGKRILFDQLDKHCNQECRLRQIQCKYCGTALKAEDLNDHLLSCVKAPFTCMSCKEQVLQNERDKKHNLLDCKKVLVCAGDQELENDDSALHVHLKDSQQVFLHQQHLALKIAARNTAKSFDNLKQKIQDGRSIGTKDINPIQEEMNILREEIEMRNKSVKDKIIRDMEARLQELETTASNQLQMIKVLQQGHSPSIQGFQSGPVDTFSSGSGLESKIAETDRQLASTYNGSFLWRIPDIKRRRDALEGKIISIYSPPFYTGRNGYKMCVRAYLNGDGIGYNLEVNGEYPRLEFLQCPYCKLILREAIQTKQGIRLCLSCYHDIQKNSKVLENFEDLVLEPNEPFYPDKAVRREVNKIPVKCENYQLGCMWTGTLSDHEANHKFACQYKSGVCPNGCGYNPFYLIN